MGSATDRFTGPSVMRCGAMGLGPAGGFERGSRRGVDYLGNRLRPLVTVPVSGASRCCPKGEQL